LTIRDINKNLVDRNNINENVITGNKVFNKGLDTKYLFVSISVAKLYYSKSHWFIFNFNTISCISTLLHVNVDYN